MAAEKIEWFVHLPGLVTGPEFDCPVGPGRIVCLDFEAWSRLDDFLNRRERFPGPEPTFFVGEVETSSFDVLEDDVAACAHRLHQALLLGNEVPLLPSPSLSVRYFRFEGAVRTHVGPLEREWVAYGGLARVELDSDYAETLPVMWELVGRLESPSIPAGVAAGTDTLELTARPENWSIRSLTAAANAFVQCIAAAEHILLPPPEEKRVPLTQTFGRHGAALLSTNRDQLEDTAHELQETYRLRSRLIHGQEHLKELSDEVVVRLSNGRAILRDCIVATLVLGELPAGYASLPDLLEAAWKSSDAHAALRAATGRG